MKNLKQKEDLPSGGSKVVRATFSLPKSCVDQLDMLQRKFGKSGHILNRSEVVRIGLAALERLPKAEFQAALSDVERLKAGRPSHIRKK